MKIHKVLQLLLVLMVCWSFAASALAKESKPNIDRIGQEGLRLSSFYARIGKTLKGSQSQVLQIQHADQAGR